MANKKLSTAELVGISHFSRNGLMTQRYGEVVYFIVQPTNISVLSETSIAIKINHLMQLLSQQPDIEIICSDARENFEYNKLSLARKAEKEDNLKVQLLLRRDMKFLDDIQLQMSTAREFMFAYRLTHESEDGALATLNRIEKHISDHPRLKQKGKQYGKEKNTPVGSRFKRSIRERLLRHGRPLDHQIQCRSLCMWRQLPLCLGDQGISAQYYGSGNPFSLRG